MSKLLWIVLIFAVMGFVIWLAKRRSEKIKTTKSDANGSSDDSVAPKRKMQSAEITRLFFAILGIIILAAMLFGFFLYGDLFFIFLVYSYFVDYIVQSAGVSIWIARILSIILAIPLVYIVKLVFSVEIFKKKDKRWIDGKRRMVGVGLLAVYLIVIFAVMDWVQRDFLFDPTTGKSIRCVAQDELTGEWIDSNCAWEFDPRTGTKVYDARGEIARQYRMQEIEHVKIDRLYPELDWAFFDNNGKPLYNYYETEDGNIEIYKLTTKYRPSTSNVLNPVSPEIASRYRKLVRGGKSRKIFVENDLVGMSKFFKSIYK